MAHSFLAAARQRAAHAAEQEIQRLECSDQCDPLAFEPYALKRDERPRWWGMVELADCLRELTQDCQGQEARIGVNLGGWLLCEAWMQETLFAKVPKSLREDEFHLAQHLSSDDMAAHWSTWITEADLEEIKRMGFNSVRLPIGFWVLDLSAVGGAIARKPAGPYTARRAWIATARPYHGPAEAIVTHCLELCEKLGLKVNVDLHGAPGGQNGEQACGFADGEWEPSMWDVTGTLLCLTRIAKLWGRHAAFDALTFINEPSNRIPIETLVDFYVRAYAATRPHTSATIFMPIYQRHWSDFIHCGFPPPHFANVRYDCHLYQCFGKGWQSLSLQDTLAKAQTGEGHWPCVHHLPDGARAVSEWSLRLPTWDPSFPMAEEVWALSSAGRGGDVYEAYARAQMQHYRKCGASSYFWTFKVDVPSRHKDGALGELCWDARECVRRGWLDPRTPLQP